MTLLHQGLRLTFNTLLDTTDHTPVHVSVKTNTLAIQPRHLLPPPLPSVHLLLPLLCPQTKDPTDILTEWSSGISSLMMLVTKTTHLINKEEMVHKHLLPSAD